MTYVFLQHYWWFLVSLLGALLVFLMFVQGANSLIASLGRTPEGMRMVLNSTGRKWEITFTTLVTFGGAFFASFPLFYSTSFGGDDHAEQIDRRSQQDAAFTLRHSENPC